jgi:hypothetical protein
LEKDFLSYPLLYCVSCGLSIHQNINTVSHLSFAVLWKVG